MLSSGQYYQVLICNFRGMALEISAINSGWPSLEEVSHSIATSHRAKNRPPSTRSTVFDFETCPRVKDTPLPPVFVASSIIFCDLEMITTWEWKNETIKVDTTGASWARSIRHPPYACRIVQAAWKVSYVRCSMTYFVLHSRSGYHVKDLAGLSPNSSADMAPPYRPHITCTLLMTSSHVVLGQVDNLVVFFDSCWSRCFRNGNVSPGVCCVCCASSPDNGNL